ncbi:MAG: AAA family ATPase [Syntrophobacteraceae bacterium]
MERLQIENFLVVRNAEFSPKKLNVLVGSQATGKSVIAKLLYFFHDLVISALVQCAFDQDHSQVFKKCALQNFEKFFPRYTWEGQPVSIKYVTDDLSISITNSPKKGAHARVSVEFSKSVQQALGDMRSKLLESNPGMLEMRADSARVRLLASKLIDSFVRTIGGTSLFIPASRSFFAYLQKNVFAFLSAGVPIDPFLQDFGAHYESAKQAYQEQKGWLFEDAEDRALRAKVDSLGSSILVGRYRHDEGADWIERDGRRVDLAHASSGQQEVLPMLVVLSVWPFLKPRGHILTFFVEEPEAHIFPISQQHVINLIGLLSNKRSSKFVITTHSPYILTAINNLIMASNVVDSQPHGKVSSVIDTDCIIKYDDVAAYAVIDGKITDICDSNVRLIDASVIDSASDILDNVFDSLLSMHIG